MYQVHSLSEDDVFICKILKVVVMVLHSVKYIDTFLKYYLWEYSMVSYVFS